MQTATRDFGLPGNSYAACFRNLDILTCNYVLYAALRTLYRSYVFGLIPVGDVITQESGRVEIDTDKPPSKDKVQWAYCDIFTRSR